MSDFFQFWYVVGKEVQGDVVVKVTYFQGQWVHSRIGLTESQTADQKLKSKWI